MTKETEGWYQPPHARKFHYFTKGGDRSLCGNWGMAWGGTFDPHTVGAGQPGREDCAKCWKEAEKRVALHNAAIAEKENV